MIAVLQVTWSTPHRDPEAPESSSPGRRGGGVCPQEPHARASPPIVAGRSCPHGSLSDPPPVAWRRGPHSAHPREPARPRAAAPSQPRSPRGAAAVETARHSANLSAVSSIEERSCPEPPTGRVTSPCSPVKGRAHWFRKTTGVVAHASCVCRVRLLCRVVLSIDSLVALARNFVRAEVEDHTSRPEGREVCGDGRRRLRPDRLEPRRD